MMMLMIMMKMVMMMKMLKMTMQAGIMLEGLCGEATVEAWLWRPPPGRWVITLFIKYHHIDISYFYILFSVAL